MANCDICYTPSETLDDLKPYQVDRTTIVEYVAGYNTKDEFLKVCHKCFDKQSRLDDYMYTALGYTLPQISWEDPLGKKSAKPVQIVNTIITNNYITNNNNNIKNEIIYDNKNINTSNYNISTGGAKVDLDSLLQKMTNTPKKSKEEKNKADIQKWEQKERLYDEKVERQNKAYEAKIKAEIAEAKKQRLKKALQKEDEIADAKEAYPDAKDFKPCLKCGIYKAFPEQFTNGICCGCFEEQAEIKDLYNKTHRVVCECGLVYLKTSDKAKVKHEQTDRHKKNMQSKLNFDGKKYSVKQLREICNANQISNASRMSKVDIVAELNKLPDVVIPEFKNL